MKKLIFLFLYISTLLQLVNAQQTFRGMVTDAETREALEMATVRLVQGKAEKLIDYALTDSRGAFSITAPGMDSLYITVAMLGYNTLKHPAMSGKEMQLAMLPASINLREVVIRPGRVWGRKDTVNYSIADFLSSKDESMKDVIKKLPGLDVDNTGNISYNGRKISNFYVEGMDLSGGRYNQINNNLQARAVEAVQVLENHQAVRMLKDKINTQDVAINLKLKPEFRDKWMVNLEGGGGYSPGNPSGKVLWNGNLNALQLSRGSQSAYIYKTNNQGIDITDENALLTLNAPGQADVAAVPGFLSQPSLMAPLKKERLLFNQVHTATANRLYKLNETTQLRLNAGYTHDVRQQQRGSETNYFERGDTLTVTEDSHTRIRTDKAEMAMYLENNSEKRYLTNRFSADGLWEKGTSRLGGNDPLTQQIRTTDMQVKNDLKSLWNKDGYTLEVKSLLCFNHLPSELRLINHNDERQRLNLNHFYTNNYLSFLKKKGSITHRYVAGASGQASNIQNAYSLYLTPNWQANLNKWRGTLNVPVVWTRMPGGNFSRVAASPSLSVLYKYNYAWQFTLYGSYKESYGDITDYYTRPYRTDYRHSVAADGTLWVKQDQTYYLYGEYKNTINEFFATLSLMHNRTRTNHINEQVIEGNQVTLVSHPLSTEATGWTLSGTLSKGFFDYGLKLSLNYAFGSSAAELMSQGERTPYKSTYMFYEPKISWSPLAQLEVDYQGTFRYGGTRIGSDTRLTPLLNVVQKINLSYSFSTLELGFTADHYYNDVSSDKGVHAFLADASLRWKPGSWQITLAANNLLDKRQYGYTQYTSLQSYTSWINIRGREFIATVGYRF